MFRRLYSAAALLLCATDVVKAQIRPVASLYLPDAQASFMINLTPNSDEVNFYMSWPTWNSYFAIGIGSTMTNSLMLVAYAAGDDQHVTVSPRLGTGQTEPAFYSGARVFISANTTVQNNNFFVSGMCRGCRLWPGGSLNTNTISQPFIFALGPWVTLQSNDQAARILRHDSFGHFSVNTIAATGYGGVAALNAAPLSITSNAALAGAVIYDSDHAAFAHGLLMVLATLLLAPIDLVAAGALRRWPILHILTSSVYLLAVLAGLGLGVKISAEYIRTASFRTGHQIFGIFIIVIMLVLALMGAVAFASRRVSLRRPAAADETPRATALAGVHKWGARLLWLMLLINCGLGLRLAEARRVFIIGYSVLAAGVFIIVMMIQLCIFCCLRKREVGSRKSRKSEESNESHQMDRYK